MFLTSCSFTEQKGYNIKEASGENWKFTGGKFLFKGGEQELKYSMAYNLKISYEADGKKHEEVIELPMEIF